MILLQGKIADFCRSGFFPAGDEARRNGGIADFCRSKSFQAGDGARRNWGEFPIFAVCAFPDMYVAAYERKFRQIAGKFFPSAKKYICPAAQRISAQGLAAEHNVCRSLSAGWFPLFPDFTNRLPFSGTLHKGGLKAQRL